MHTTHTKTHRPDISEAIARATGTSGDAVLSEKTLGDSEVYRFTLTYRSDGQAGVVETDGYLRDTGREDSELVNDIEHSVQRATDRLIEKLNEHSTRNRAQNTARGGAIRLGGSETNSEDNIEVPASGTPTQPLEPNKGPVVEVSQAAAEDDSLAGEHADSDQAPTSLAHADDEVAGGGPQNNVEGDLTEQDAEKADGDTGNDISLEGADKGRQQSEAVAKGRTANEDKK